MALLGRVRNEETRPRDARTLGITGTARGSSAARTISTARTSCGVRNRAPRALAAGSAAVLAALLTAGPAAAAPASAYGQWAATGQSGTLTVPVPGFPTAQLATTSTSVQIPSGASSFLNPATPFGAAFGSSQGKPYLVLRTAPGLARSTTVLDFAAPTPADGWGFALGDIDADLVQVSATGPSGDPVPIADLGFQSTFNYCTGAPLPSACAGSTATDRPVWDAGTGTLTGNVADTNGASGWFRPRVPIKTLTLQFAAQSGIPVYQLWVAAQASQTPPVQPTPPINLPTAPPVTPTIVGEGSPAVIVLPPAIDHREPVDIVTPPQHGTVTHLANGNLLYTPGPEYTGTDSFTYRGRSRSGATVTESVQLKVVATLATTGAGQTFPLLELGGGLLFAGIALATVAKLRTRGEGRRD